MPQQTNMRATRVKHIPGEPGLATRSGLAARRLTESRLAKFASTLTALY
jgi:hypothetical protein